VIQGSAKAWVNFNGSTAVIRSSHNVGSITKTGTGNYTINFSTAMPDANYSVIVAAQDDGAGNGNGVHTAIHSTGLTNNNVAIGQYSWAGSWTDLPTFCVAVFR
jgi:hypothetical protein